MLNLKEEHSKFVKLYFFSSGVTTPTNMRLAEEMLSHLDEELFKNPNSKFLDPCAGTGTFGVVLYDKLLKYHDSKWILENMIFMVDTSRVICDILKKLGFINVYNEDSNKMNFNMEFDWVGGNPPFSSTSKEPVRLWASFVEHNIKRLTKDGKLQFVTPSTWMSSTNSVYDLLKDKIEYVNVSDYVSKSFGSVGGSQKFVYFTANKEHSNKCITKFDGDVELEFNPTNTPISPIKSSSYFIFDLVEKLYKSEFPIFNWIRFDRLETSSGVIVPMAKAATYEVQFHEVDDFEIGRYKVYLDEELGKIISHNLNTKTYQILRWVLRSGPALASNFKLLPIPSTLMNDDELLDYLGMSDEAKKFIKLYVV
jgi:16S rRNA G966 N2-methylase RsmD